MNAEQREARVVEIQELVNDLFDAVSGSKFGAIYHDCAVTPGTPSGKSVNNVAFAVFQSLLVNMCPKSPSRVVNDTNMSMRHDVPGDSDSSGGHDV